MIKKPRILFTIPNFITAGSGQVLFNIVERLDQRRFRLTVCVSKRGGRLDSEVERLGVNFLELPFTVPPKPYSTLLLRTWKAAQAFRPYEFDLWHSFHYASDYTEPIMARLAGAKRWIYTKKAMGWGSRAWLLRSYLASAIVADNTDMPYLFFDRIGLRDKVTVIPHSVPTTIFSSTPCPDTRLGRVSVFQSKLSWWVAWPTSCRSRAILRFCMR